ncbi:MAG: EAL domain-containing protein [Asticcacaulis sp.]
MFGGLFSLALLCISVACYLAILNYAEASVQREMVASSSVFRHLWELKSESQRTSAVLLSRDFGFKTALATQDMATIESAFDTLQARLNSDGGLVIGPQGYPMVGDQGPLGQRIAAALRGKDGYIAGGGIIAVDGKPYQTVAAPVMAPDLLGWVVFASRLDDKEMQSLQRLSSIPLQAVIVTRSGRGRWTGPGKVGEMFAPDQLDRLVDTNLAKPSAALVPSLHGKVIATTTQLPSLDPGQTSVLILTYPLATAMKAYQPLLSALMAIGAIGLGFVVLAGLYLARSLTRPIMALKEAAEALKDGHAHGFTEIAIDTQDEMADLSRAFNTMAIAIKDREREIMHMARHDESTGLPNRAAFEDHISAMREKGVEGGMVTVCIGIDRYSHIRAVWGVNYAHVLVGRLRDILVRIFDQAYIARLSADSLGLVLAPCAAEQAMPLARAIAARLDKRIRISEEQSLDVPVSIGVYHDATGRPSTNEMVERAQIALDQARAGKIKVAQFDPRIYSELADTLLLTDQLHAALQGKVLTVHYQPKYSYREGRITSVEALVRWNHPERGMVSPQRFVTIAEESGYIRDLTQQVFATCIRDQGLLVDAGFPIDFSINYSGRLLSDDNFNSRTLAMCAEAKGKICLEITETAVIEDPRIGLAAIARFAESGLEISIDDFGTGLSSLAYLKQIPAQELKIDRAFISEIEQGQRDALLVRSAIDLAHGLGMKVTAEGVETGISFTLLQAMGCDMAQGYGIARPMAFDDLVTFLRDFAIAPKGVVAQTAANQGMVIPVPSSNSAARPIRKT